MGFTKQVWQMIVQSNLLTVLGAIAVLLIGWLIALLVSRKVSDCVLQFTTARNKLQEKDFPQLNHVDTVAGKIVYYIILIFGVLGCFSILKMDAAAAPLQTFISRIAEYAPNIAGAMLLFVIAIIAATVTRSVVRSIITRTKLNEYLTVQLQFQNGETLSSYIAQTSYYLILLFFLPAILKALRLYGITEPLQRMFEKILTFVPNLAASIAIIMIGLLVAQIIRKTVTGLVIISRLNSLGEQFGVSKILGNTGLASMAGTVVYILVAIPAVISALTALQITVLSQSVAGFFDKLLNATGDIVGAALIIFIAFIAGSFISSLVAQLTANFGLNQLIASLGFKSEKKDSILPSTITGRLCFIAIMILAAIAACEILNFEQLAVLIQRFAYFGGNVLLSVLVIMFGVWLANFTTSAIKGKCSDMILMIVHASIVIFTAALAISNLNIGGNIVHTAFALILGAVSVAFAIAFGFGGKEAAAKLLENWSSKLKK